MTAITVKKKIEPAQNNRLMYTVPYGKAGTFNLNICNLNHAEIRRVRVIITDGTPHTPADYVEYATPLPPCGVLERTGLVMKTGDNLFVTSLDGTDVSARLYGFLEDA